MYEQYGSLERVQVYMFKCWLHIFPFWLQLLPILKQSHFLRVPKGWEANSEGLGRILNVSNFWKGWQLCF